MSKPESNSTLPALVPTGSSALTVTTGSQRIATRMATNLLDVAHSQELALAAQRRYRVGEYEFREADYAQIQTWVRILGTDAEKVVKTLASSHQYSPWGEKIYADFRVVDGAIVSLVWDFDLLPLTDWAWVRGLQIIRLGILNAPSGFLPPLPECLYELFCHAQQLTELDLTSVPGLKTLYCGGNPLIGLDLTPVSGLLKLACWGSTLTDLDLTSVPGLQLLACGGNQLARLDLTSVPGLQKLLCEDNRLAKLDLTLVPGLQILHCWGNPLTELDLTPVPSLQTLRCDASVNIKGAPQNLQVSRR